MHLAVDIVGVKHSGGATVLLDFLQTARKDTRISQISLFCSPRPQRQFDLPVDRKIMAYEQPLAETSYLYRIFWHEVILKRKCKHIGANVLLCMTGAGRTNPVIPHITLIQQALPFAVDYSTFATPVERVRMVVVKALMYSSCRSAKLVIVQTPTMQGWVSQQLMLSPDCVEVVPPCVTLLPTVPSHAPPLLNRGGPPKLLYVGGVSRYKNVETIIAGLKSLRSALPATCLYLTWPQDHPASRLEGIVCLGHLTRDRLAQAYSEATLLVMPSLIETVGLPILEAMSAGCPVLAADRRYAHDTSEDAACFFDPFSPSDFVLRAKTLLQDRYAREELVRRGRAVCQRRSCSDPYGRMADLIVKCM